MVHLLGENPNPHPPPPFSLKIIRLSWVIARRFIAAAIFRGYVTNFPEFCESSYEQC